MDAIDQLKWPKMSSEDFAFTLKHLGGSATTDALCNYFGQSNPYFLAQGELVHEVAQPALDAGLVRFENGRWLLTDEGAAAFDGP